MLDMSDVESNINIKYVNQCVIFEKNKKNYENFNNNEIKFQI